MKKKLLALLLALLLCQGLVVPALAVVEEIAAVKVDDVAGYSQSDGVYTVVRDGLYGFCFADGTELAAPEFTHAEDFQNGMAVVSLDGGRQYGYLDLNGKMAVSARYRQAFPFAQDRAFAVRERGGVLVLLDRSGQELASFPDATLQPGDQIQFHEGLAVIPTRAAEKDRAADAPLVYQVVNLAGEEVCTLTDAYVDYVNGYHDGRIAAAESGEWVETGNGAYRRFQAGEASWGYRDAAGELVIDYQYDEAVPFSEGVAGVGGMAENRMLYGFAGLYGEEVLPVAYDGFVSCVNGSGAVLQNGRWALVDASGQILTDFQFESVSNYTEDAARIEINGRRGLADASGKILFTVEGGQMLPCSGGVIPVQNGDGLWGIYDKQGNLLVDFKYDRACHWDGYLWLKRGDLWRVYLTEEVLADRAAAAGADAETEPVASVGTYSDVAPDAFYAQAVTWATDSDIATGTGGGQFSPDRLCTTGEILVCLWRAAGRPEPQIENPFTDVSPNHYYYQAALWAHEKGLVAGEVFAAAEPCTRAMVVTYLWSTGGRPYAMTDVFADVPPEAEYAQAVAWAVERGITEGSDSGLFDPAGICSRGEIVTFLYRYLAE